jgi:large subunit ribosomal protein L28
MAKCEYCGKTTQFGRHKSFSQKRTPRKYYPNLQKTRVLESGVLTKRILCTRCLKALSKPE